MLGDGPERTSVRPQNDKLGADRKPRLASSLLSERKAQSDTEQQWDCPESPSASVRIAVQGSATLVFGDLVSLCDGAMMTKLRPEPAKPRLPGLIAGVPGQATLRNQGVSAWGNQCGLPFVKQPFPSPNTVYLPSRAQPPGKHRLALRAKSRPFLGNLL